MINPALFSSDSPEHYTPEHIIEASVKCMERIDSDPCSNSHEYPNVPATTLYTKEDDGLSKEWDGFVFLNPPFSVPKFYKDGTPSLGKPKIVNGVSIQRQIQTPVIHLWIKKLVYSYHYGKVQKAIALVPSRTDTEWYALLDEFPVCNVSGRLKFSNSENSAPFPSAIFALGINTTTFADCFAEIGRTRPPVITPF